MADPRQAERDVTEPAREATRKTAEETRRATRAAADASASAARVGADLFQHNAETMRDAWNSGTKAAGQMTERTMELLARAFGVTGEGAQQAAQQSSRNLECLVQSGTIFAGSMQSISREMLEFARNRVEQNFHKVDALVGSRTPQQFIAAQSEFVRDNLEGFVHSTRRIAEISMQTADEAARRMSDLTPTPR